MNKSFNPLTVRIVFIALFAIIIVTSFNVHAQNQVSPATKLAIALGIPTMDDMAGKWMPMETIENPPSLHNFNNMLIVDRDLTSYFFSPGGWLYNLAAYADAKEPSVWRRGYPAVKLLIDGYEYPAKESRLGGYRVLRRNLHCNGIAVETDTRMVNEQRGVLSQITFTNTTLINRKFVASLSMPGSLQADQIGVANEFQRSGVISIIRPSHKPDEVEIDSYIVAAWKYNIELPPGGTFTLGFVAGDEPIRVSETDGFIQGDIGNEKGGEANASVTNWAKHFDTVFAESKEAWENRWADAFTPGNKHFSGHLPVLTTNDLALRRNYYMGVYTLLCLERTQFALHPRSFVTNGERDDGTQFYGDIAWLPTTWALLEPDGMKTTLRRWLVQNLRNGAWLDIRQTQGYDTKKYDRMYGYATNALLFFKTVDTYLRVTGDKAFLDEMLEDGKTVLEHMDLIATDWETLPRGTQDLVDYGGNECLLECVPHYTNCVASMNAQAVWMMRQMAQWHSIRGNTARSEELQTKATAFLPKVLGLYKPGDGIWYTYHTNGEKVEIRHCMDYLFVGDALQNDLTATQKTEMNNFVQKELFMRDWMRAMSLKDAAAKLANRTDHGPYGSYTPWIPLTVSTMWRLGDPNAAYNFYRRTAAATSEGIYPQTIEFYGPTRDSYNAPVRISSDRGNMRESLGGGTFTEVVITTFFGFNPDRLNTHLIADPETPRPFSGELSNIHFTGKEITLKANSIGIKEIPVK